MPPKKLGRDGAIGAAGWLSEREGLVGVVGDAGDDGRAGAEYERDPRLPLLLPPLARAKASPAWPAIMTPSARPINAIQVRDLIGVTSICVV